MGRTDDNDRDPLDLLRTRYDLDRLVDRVGYLEQAVKDLLTEIRPMLADHAYSRRRRAEALSSLALTGKIVAILAAAAVILQSAVTVTH